MDVEPNKLNCGIWHRQNSGGYLNITNKGLKMTTEKTNLQWKAPAYAKNNTRFLKITQSARKISSAYMDKKRKKWVVLLL